MKNQNSFLIFLIAVFLSPFSVTAQNRPQEPERKFGNISARGMNIRWDAGRHAGMTITISTPDGRVLRKDIPAGAASEVSLKDLGENLPDGTYAYELRRKPVSSTMTKEMSSARRKDDEPEATRAARKPVLESSADVESGNFSVVRGAVIVAGELEQTNKRSDTRISQSRFVGAAEAAISKIRQHHLLSVTPDHVIPDDLIVIGSECVGLDCVNNEDFGFDTIRMKENNTRLQFNDTSTSAGFPTNNWQIRANSSLSGGGSFLAFVDQGNSGTSETGTIVLEADAGAPANSLRISSVGRLGLRTATPAMDVHMNTSNTPALRLEQNNSGGFSAQTWDIAGNEANFFVRDVTSGSRLPFRIRPGAPTSSIDISADGDVGIGTASPDFKLEVQQNQNASTFAAVTNTDATDLNSRARFLATGGTVATELQSLATSGGFVGTTSNHPLNLYTNGSTRILVEAGGNVGIATPAPTDTLSVNGTASKPGGGDWATFSDERLKDIRGHFNRGLKAVMQLQPVRYEYRKKNALKINLPGEYIGFGAQTVQKIIPEAVTTNSQGYLMIHNDPILWTMLNAIKEQQKEIEKLKAQVRSLRAGSKRLALAR